jgi:hypothetical protein
MRLVAFLLFTSFVFGQIATQSPKAQAPASPPTRKNQNQDIGLGIDAHGRQIGTFDILSDTQGVDFRPYMRRLLENVRENSYHLIPKCAETMKGRLAIEFAVQKFKKTGA